MIRCVLGETGLFVRDMKRCMLECRMSEIYLPFLCKRQSSEKVVSLLDSMSISSVQGTDRW
jgi:hypothetical protein